MPSPLAEHLMEDWVLCERKAIESPRGAPSDRNVWSAIEAEARRRVTGTVPDVGWLPDYLRFDNLTGHARHAETQAKMISNKALELLGEDGWLPINTGHCTCIVAARGHERAVGMLYTATHLPASAWLQATAHADPHAADRVMVLHVPRISTSRDQTGTVTMRPRQPGLKAAYKAFGLRFDAVSSGQAPAVTRPGPQCRSCRVPDCPIRTVERT